jgi:hypothetical protein
VLCTVPRITHKAPSHARCASAPYAMLSCACTRGPSLQHTLPPCFALTSAAPWQDTPAARPEATQRTAAAQAPSEAPPTRIVGEVGLGPGAARLQHCPVVRACSFLLREEAPQPHLHATPRPGLMSDALRAVSAHHTTSHVILQCIVRIAHIVILDMDKRNYTACIKDASETNASCW